VRRIGLTGEAGSKIGRYRSAVSTRTSPWAARSGPGLPVALGIGLIVAALMTGLGVIVPLTPAYATNNGFWSLTPPPEPDGKVPDVVKLELAPGSVTSTPVVVTNLTNNALTIKSANALSPVANDATTKGAIDSNDATKWAIVSNTEVTTAARKSQILTVRFRIPTNAKAGDYAGQLVTFGAPVALPNGAQTQDRTLTLRFSIRVTGDIKPSVELSTLDVQEQLLFFRLTNTGNTLLQPKISLQGLDTKGAPISVLDAPIGELFPGESRAIQSPLGTTPTVLKVTVATEGGDTVGEWPLPGVGAVVLADGEVPPPPPNPGSTTASLIVFSLLALFLIILIWWATAVRRKRRRRLAERWELIEGARQSELRGEEAAAAAVAASAASAPPSPAILGPGDPFPPPGGAPIGAVNSGAVTLAAVAAGTVSLDQLAAAGAPFPPPSPNSLVAPVATNESVVAFPPPQGAPVG